MTDIWSTQLPKPEYLFKQSTYGGFEHLIVNVDDYSEYMLKGDIRAPLYIETLCGKKLKFNAIFSLVRQKAGLLRNVCPNCITEYDPDEQPVPRPKDTSRYGEEPF